MQHKNLQNGDKFMKTINSITYVRIILELTEEKVKYHLRVVNSPNSSTKTISRQEFIKWIDDARQCYREKDMTIDTYYDPVCGCEVKTLRSDPSVEVAGSVEFNKNYFTR